jgi:hypothetical protein
MNANGQVLGSQCGSALKDCEPQGTCGAIWPAFKTTFKAALFLSGLLPFSIISGN